MKSLTAAGENKSKTTCSRSLTTSMGKLLGRSGVWVVRQSTGDFKSEGLCSAGNITGKLNGFRWGLVDQSFISAGALHDMLI